MKKNAPPLSSEQQIEDLKQALETICHSKENPIEKAKKFHNWLEVHKAQLKELPESERNALFQMINHETSVEFRKIFDAMKTILQSLKPDLDACYRDELTDEQLIDLQQKVYDAFADLAKSYPLEYSDAKRSIYQLTDVIQAISWPIVWIDEQYDNKKSTVPLGQFMHDIAGQEMDGVQHMGTIADFREMLADPGNTQGERLAAYVEWQNGLIKSSRIGILKFLACTELLAWRLNPETKLREDTFDLKDLIEKTGHSQSVRFNFNNKINLSCEVSVEEVTNTVITASEEMLYIIFMNILKNAGKIMVERKTPEADQKVAIRLFEEDGILFVHYTDRIGGLDLTKLYQSAVRRVREITKSKAGELLPHPLQLIAGGSFHAADQMTMRDLCELIFLDRVHAREGGSGIGMAEAKDLMAKNGMYISTALNREDGTQFLLAFPRTPMDAKTLKEKMAKVEGQLDRAENEKLGLPLAA